MFIRALRYLFRDIHLFTKRFSTTSNSNFKVTLVGGAGGTGARLCLLLKLQPDLVSEINIYDVAKYTPGVVLDISHICTAVKVNAFTGLNELKDALRGADIVIILGSAPRKPGMTREDLFSANASVIIGFAQSVAECCPDAMVNIVTNPVNSCVPIFCEAMSKIGRLKPSKIFGVTTVDLVRASTLIAKSKHLDPAKVDCPVVGGHSGTSIVPLLSQCKPSINFTKGELTDLVKGIQEAGMDVARAKAETGISELAMAYAGARFVSSLLRAKRGDTNVVEYAYMMNDSHKTGYISTKLLLGKNGLEKDLGIGKLTEFEQELFNNALKNIKGDVEIAVNAVK